LYQNFNGKLICFTGCHFRWPTVGFNSGSVEFVGGQEACPFFTGFSVAGTSTPATITGKSIAIFDG
jgi:hypothetical protein